METVIIFAIAFVHMEITHFTTFEINNLTFPDEIDGWWDLNEVDRIEVISPNPNLLPVHHINL